MRTLLIVSLSISLFAVACGAAGPDETLGGTSEALNDGNGGTEVTTPTVGGIATSPGSTAASDAPAVDGIATSPGSAAVSEPPLVAEKDKKGGTGTGIGPAYCKICHKICLPNLKECAEQCYTVRCSNGI